MGTELDVCRVIRVVIDHFTREPTKDDYALAAPKDG